MRAIDPQLKNIERLLERIHGEDADFDQVYAIGCLNSFLPATAIVIGIPRGITRIRYALNYGDNTGTVNGGAICAAFPGSITAAQAKNQLAYISGAPATITGALAVVGNNGMTASGIGYLDGTGYITVVFLNTGSTGGYCNLRVRSLRARDRARRGIFNLRRKTTVEEWDIPDEP